MCSRNAVQSDASRTLDALQDAATAEWARFIPPQAAASPSVEAGAVAEALHPNAYGQKALGRCLTLLWHEAPPGGHYACNGTADVAPADMIILPER